MSVYTVHVQADVETFAIMLDLTISGMRTYTTVAFALALVLHCLLAIHLHVMLQIFRIVWAFPIPTATVLRWRRMEVAS